MGSNEDKPVERFDLYVSGVSVMSRVVGDAEAAEAMEVAYQRKLADPTLARKDIAIAGPYGYEPVRACVQHRPATVLVTKETLRSTIRLLVQAENCTGARFRQHAGGKGAPRKLRHYMESNTPGSRVTITWGPAASYAPGTSEEAEKRALIYLRVIQEATTGEEFRETPLLRGLRLGGVTFEVVNATQEPDPEYIGQRAQLCRLTCDGNVVFSTYSRDEARVATHVVHSLVFVSGHVQAHYGDGPLVFGSFLADYVLAAVKAVQRAAELTVCPLEVTLFSTERHAGEYCGGEPFEDQRLGDRIVVIDVKGGSEAHGRLHEVLQLAERLAKAGVRREEQESLRFRAFVYTQLSENGIVRLRTY